MKRGEKKETGLDKSEKTETQKQDVSWKIIDKYFKDNPSNLVAHHLDSYNNFFDTGIYNIFKENNPVRFIEREDRGNPNSSVRNECLLYLGGKNGDKIYFGKPIIYDDYSTSGKTAHYMYPNEARLRNMTYGITIHYDVDVEFTYYTVDDDEKKTHDITLEKIYLGRFPIMLQSNLCILKGMSTEARFNLGECRNDYGGYFIIDGKEKVIIPQEKFADNMLYIRKIKDDGLSPYSHSAEIRSVSEDASKPVRTMSVKIVAPSPSLSNNQIVVNVPNVRQPVPLFILMRALGIIPDKQIIEYCLLDLDKNAQYVDLFIPSVHHAGVIFNQETALEYIKLLTKRKTITGVLDILVNYFLPHIGEKNLLDKAYYVGYMVMRLLRVFTNEEKPTDRDNFKFKRIELSGILMYDLFREYHMIQKRNLTLKIDSKYYFHKGDYKSNFIGLIDLNYPEFFKERVVEVGFRKGFKGNWGSESHTKRVGVVQDLNRLSWYSFISHLRKLNLPLDSSAKVVGPRLLNSSQWGFIDPVDTPDGGNIGLHKHMALSAFITSGYSCWPLIQWLRAKTSLRILQECQPRFLATLTKVFVNGIWVGGIDTPIEFVNLLRLFRRNGLLPVYTSISFNYESNEVNMYSDAGRLTRPIFFLEGEGVAKKISYQRENVLSKLSSNKEEFTWQQIVSGFKEKSEGAKYSYKHNTIYGVEELYPTLKTVEHTEKELEHNKAVFDYVDTSEEEGLLIANNPSDLIKNKYYTHMEWCPSLLFGVMGNQIVFPENNPLPRNAFSCGQSKQAVSLYHSNYQMRMDKMGVVLNNGQMPLVNSRFGEYIQNNEQSNGVNTIVAIMSYTGYNVEDAILINEGAVKRGLFNTTYFTMYESREESSKVSGSMSNSVFADVSKKNVVGLKPGYDYSYLDEWGLVKENTVIDEKIVMIGKVTVDSEDSERISDSSVFTKKGQLGFVDKSFITEGEEGFRIAKIRVREERTPAIGDKMASRVGQKGTIGLIIPEEDMPFAADGMKPDLIINPHALPSRMTIGQLIESVLGKICTHYGGMGDCTAFETKGANTEIYSEALANAGYHSSGNHIMYNGMTGEQINTDIFIGPTYYMRLKHMVKDKINYRARGPNTMLTRQAVQGRANDGGLRIGEMERDGVMAHGASAFLNDSFMTRGDEYYMAICNKTGGAAIYNPSLNLFLSPFADGPIRFTDIINGKEKQNIENVSRFGRSFSIVRIPYSLKLLMQELQVMNIQMRVITEDNIDQLVSMCYSTNVKQLLKTDFDKDKDKDMEALIRKMKKDVSDKIKSDNQMKNNRVTATLTMNVQPVYEYTTIMDRDKDKPYGNNPDDSPPYNVTAEYSPPYAQGTPYIPTTLDTPNIHNSDSPQYNPYSSSPNYVPYTPNGSPPQPNYVQHTPNGSPPQPNGSPPQPNGSSPQDNDLKSQIDALSEDDKKELEKIISEKRGESTTPMTESSILDVPEEKKMDTSSSDSSDTNTEDANIKKGETKKITFA